MKEEERSNTCNLIDVAVQGCLMVKKDARPEILKNANKNYRDKLIEKLTFMKKIINIQIYRNNILLFKYINLTVDSK